MKNIPITGSDHGPIFSSMDCWNWNNKYTPFRFKVKWLLQQNFTQLVQQTWTKFIKGPYIYQLTRKIELIMKEIKMWKRSVYNNDYHDIDLTKNRN